MIRRRVNYPSLPQVEDLFRIIEEWCKATGVTKSELADVIDVNRSGITRLFSDRRRLRYDEAQDIVDYLMNRLAPFPDEPIKTLAIKPRELKQVQITDTVAQTASKLIDGEFTQVPVFDRDRFVGLATDKMILERLLLPNKRKFKDSWIRRLGNMPVKYADIIETSAIYPLDASISSVASALKGAYAIMLSENDRPKTIVTRWDYLKLLT